MSEPEGAKPADALTFHLRDLARRAHQLFERACMTTPESAPALANALETLAADYRALAKEARR